MLKNIDVNIEHCGQQNIIQSCFHHHCNKLLMSCFVVVTDHDVMYTVRWDTHANCTSFSQWKRQIVYVRLSIVDDFMTTVKTKSYPGLI